MKSTKQLYLDYLPELDTPRYLAGDVAAATGVATGTLKAWLTREPHVVPLGPHDQEGRGKGTPRLFTLRRVCAIAMTSELVSMGIAAGMAGDFAFRFTDMKGHPWSLNEGYRALSESPDRVFVAFNPSESLFVTTSQDATFGELMRQTKQLGIVSWAVIDCSGLMERVRTRLKERGA